VACEGEGAADDRYADRDVHDEDQSPATETDRRAADVLIASSATFTTVRSSTTIITESGDDRRSDLGPAWRGKCLMTDAPHPALLHGSCGLAAPTENGYHFRH
jgi:hypothetical protein